MLPDDVLLEIFDFYLIKFQHLDFRDHYNHGMKEPWISLVHVCRRWRSLVFGSPRRLNLQLQLLFDYKRSVTRTLDIWPALPLVIQGFVLEKSVDDIIAELKHCDRIHKINLHCVGDIPVRTENFWAAMQVPFPELESLTLSSSGASYVPVLPDSILGGSAPRLRLLTLDSISFPGLPNLLLSTTHLVKLYLDISRSGYISPEAMATCLSVLTSLEKLYIRFNSAQISPDQESRPHLTRSILPALKNFSFRGVLEYLEGLVARINTPRLSYLSTKFFNYIGSDFVTPELNQFISRTPMLGTYDEARLIFYDDEDARVVLRQSHTRPSDHRVVEVRICSKRQISTISTLAQICTLSLRHLLTMQKLYIDRDTFSQHVWKDPDNTEWSDLLLPFTAVKDLYLSQAFSPHIVLALQERTGGRTTEVLPALQNVFLEGFQPSEPVEKRIAEFISARQLTNHPVVISVWD